MGNGVSVGAYLQSQDLQRQLSRRQDEIDAENRALADRLERAVQAATIDAAEKKSLQVQHQLKTPSVESCCMTGVAALPGRRLASPAACFCWCHTIFQHASLCPPCCPHTLWDFCRTSSSLLKSSAWRSPRGCWTFSWSTTMQRWAEQQSGGHAVPPAVQRPCGMAQLELHCVSIAGSPAPRSTGCPSGPLATICFKHVGLNLSA